MVVNLIAAVGQSGQLGLDGRLACKNSDDLRWFKKLTCENPFDFVIMGSQTYKSLVENYATPQIPPLPGRNLIIHHFHRTVYRKCKYGDENAYTIEEFDFMTPLQIIEKFGSKNLWVIGGLQIFNIYLPYIQRFHIARLDYDGPADVYFDILKIEKGEGS